MLKTVAIGLASASIILPCLTQAADYADSVVGYNPGVGVATDFTGHAYTNTAAALGQPSRVTPGTFGGPVDPFNPPYLARQLVSVGSGGSLTVKFSQPVLNYHDN